MKFYCFTYHSSNIVKDMCTEHKIPLLQLNCNFQPNMYYKSDNHLNNLAQLEIKNKFTEKIIALIPKKYKHN
jgi:hypothetical protein